MDLPWYGSACRGAIRHAATLGKGGPTRHTLGALALVLASACGSGGGGTTTDCADLTKEGSTFTIRMSESRFVPDCFTASASQGIRLVNEDDVQHTFTMLHTPVDVIVDGGQTFEGGPVAGEIEPGDYVLICRFHELMQGNVTVVA